MDYHLPLDFHTNSYHIQSTYEYFASNSSLVVSLCKFWQCAHFNAAIWLSARTKQHLQLQNIYLMSNVERLPTDNHEKRAKHQYKSINTYLFGGLNFFNSAAFSLLCMLHCTTHARRFLPLVVCTISLISAHQLDSTSQHCQEFYQNHKLPKTHLYHLRSILWFFSDQLIFGLIWVRQSIPRMTSAFSSDTTQHQTICVASEANKILNLANLVLSTLNFFPRVMHISSNMVVAFTACISAALTKLCIALESIKKVLQYTHYTLIGNSRSCKFFERFLPNAQAPYKCKH